jgi:phage FluMu protein Com
MSPFLTRCADCNCLLQVTGEQAGDAKRTVRCPRCKKVQTVSAPAASPPNNLRERAWLALRSPGLIWFEQKAIWFLLPVTLWLAWSVLRGSNSTSEPRPERRASEFVPSKKLRIPLRLWKQFEADDRAFSVRMPGTPKTLAEAARKTNGRTTKTWSVVLNPAPGGEGEMAFHVSCFTIPNTDHLHKFQGNLHWLTCLQAQDFPDLQKCSVRPIQKNGADGGEFFLELGDTQVVRHAYVDRLNVYYVTCTGSDLDAYREDWRLFLDSFEFQRNDNQRAQPEVLQAPK